MRRKRDEVYIDTQDIIGTTIGYWRVLEYSHKSITYSGSRKLTRHWYKCKCACGRIKLVRRDSLIGGLSNTCGCSLRRKSCK